MSSPLMPVMPGQDVGDDNLLAHGGPTPADPPAVAPVTITQSPPVYISPPRASILLACTACGVYVPENMRTLHDAWHADERTATVMLDENGEPVG